MLHHLHTTLSSLLHARGQIPQAEVDVLFEIPTRQWVESLARPAVCCYMFDMAEVAEFRNAGAQVSRTNGRAVTKLPPRRMDLRYMVCAFSSSRADEQILVWRAMAVFMKHTTLPPDLMPKELRALDMPINTKIGPYPESPKVLELWGALDLPPRPALLLSVTAPLDLELEFEAPLVLSRSVRLARPGDDAMAHGEGIDPERVTRRHDASREPLDGVVLSRRVERVKENGKDEMRQIERHLVGGVVRDAAGVPVEGLTVRAANHAARCVTDEGGRFRLDNLPAGGTKLAVSVEPEDVARGKIPLAERKPAAARALRLVPAPIEFDVELPWPFDLDVEQHVVLYHTTGVVRDEQDIPLQGIEIGVLGTEKPASTTNRDGRFALALPADETTLWACHTGNFRPTIGTVTIPAHSAINFVLYHTSGVVHDEKGQPLQGIEIGVLGIEEPVSTTNREGRFALMLPAGETTLWARKAGAASATIGTVTIPARSSLNFVI